MKPLGLGLFALSCAACGLVVGDYEIADAGADHTSGGDDGGGDDASGGGDGSAGDARSDANTGGDASSCSGSMQSGTVLCTNVLNELCARRVSCAASAQTCEDCGFCSSPPCSTCSRCSQATCLQMLARTTQGYDCTLPKFANRMLCSTATDACIGALPTEVVCTDSVGRTWNWPASCVTFWSQF